jgi:hypothetical protein
MFSHDLGRFVALTMPAGNGRYLRIAVALVSDANVRFSTTLHKYADWV